MAVYGLWVMGGGWGGKCEGASVFRLKADAEAASAVDAVVNAFEAVAEEAGVEMENSGAASSSASGSREPPGPSSGPSLRPSPAGAAPAPEAPPQEFWQRITDYRLQITGPGPAGYY